MARFIKGFIGTCALLLALLVAGVLFSMLKNGASFSDASLLFTLGLGYVFPLMLVFGTVGGVLWSYKAPAGRFSGVLRYDTKEQSNNYKFWIYLGASIGGRNTGTAVVPDKLKELWEESRNSQAVDVLKIGRAVVVVRNEKWGQKEWNLKLMRAAYPITCNVMLALCLLGGTGLLWLVPVYLWGAMRASSVLGRSSAPKAALAGARV